VSGARDAGPRGSPERRAYLRAFAVAGATAAGLFLAMVAAQLRSTGSAVDQTVREARNLDFITESTFGIDDMVALLMPRMLGGNTYLGAGAIIWAAIALTAFVSGRRLVLAGVAVVGFACALGQTGDFLAFGASAFELFGFFRRAHRYLYVTQLPIAILAAEGLDGSSGSRSRGGGKIRAASWVASRRSSLRHRVRGHPEEQPDAQRCATPRPDLPVECDRAG
jgi:hypothetical protein